MSRCIQRLLSRTLPLLLLLALLPLPHAIPTAASPRGQLNDPAAIIASWTPEERVGQLMLVTFESSSLRRDTAIAQLISQYNVGGVVLLAENDNINGQVNTPRLVQSLTIELQQLAYDSAQTTADRPTPRAFVPLFITTTHAGNGQPGTQIAQDTTPLPSQLALGATWNTGFARQVGQIAGIELSAMGINMLLGPALDVAQQQQAEHAIDLGVHTYGGEPNWVGQMGAHYITGVHEGSHGRIAVIAQDFPGLGFADTRPDQEIPVVPRSVAQLSAFDLLPFYAVTGAAGDTLARADGMQCANIRYQGETVRSITGPVCVNEDAAQDLLSLDYFSAWREDGIMVSSALGTPAIRRYYNVTPFPHRQVAREAFLAGNDLLYLNDFGPTPTDDQFDNVVDVINFFAERYEDDPVFRARVDKSLYRILRLKLDLYDGDFTINNVQLMVNDVNDVGGYTAGLYSIAEQAVTLLAPRRESLPSAPSRDDTIVIFTDVRLVQQCSYCATYPLVTVNALESAIERLYGPYADAQIRPEQVISFSFNQLQTYLAGDVAGEVEIGQIKTNQRIGEALREVDWIIFVMLDVDPNIPSSLVVRQLLESGSTMVERAEVAVFAMGAPTYLSSTEVSKFSAYYGLYSHTQPFIDAAARALFRDSSFPGAPSISVPAVGYDVLVHTSPDPTQILKLELVALNGNPPLNPVAAADILPVQVGDQLDLRTYPILDRNKHIVPDNTPVEFTITFITDNLQTRQPGVTVSGMAHTRFTPTRPGRIQITLSTKDATTSTTFQINVLEPGDAALIDNTPAAGQADAETTLPAAPPDDDELAAPVANGTPPPQNVTGPDAAAGDPRTPDGTNSASGTDRRLDAVDFVLSLFALALMSIAGYTQGRTVTHSAAGGVRVVLGSIVAGLTGYIYYGVDGPGMAVLHDLLDNLAPLLTTAFAGLIGTVMTWWLLHREIRVGH